MGAARSYDSLLAERRIRRQFAQIIKLTGARMQPSIWGLLPCLDGDDDRRSCSVVHYLCLKNELQVSPAPVLRCTDR